jgi:hypothetical protein
VLLKFQEAIGEGVDEKKGKCIERRSVAIPS